MTRSHLNARIRPIRLVVFDVDGVLTDGAVRLTSRGQEIKSFHVHDGSGMKYLQRAGVGIALLSGRRSAAVDHRARELGIRYVLQGYKSKIKGLDRLVARARVPARVMCFVGDDLPDVPVMRRVGLAVAVANARPEVRRIAHWTTRREGGHGAAREVAEKILKTQGHWGRIVARYGLPFQGRLSKEPL